MRRILFTILACTALSAAVPTVALAHDGRDNDHHQKRHHHHARVRHEKFVGHRHDGDHNGNPANEPTAGTVTSFANDTLTITLANGNTVSGIVTDGTEVRCENPADNDVEHGDRVTDHGPGGGDNSGNGDNDGRGDDNGDRGDDNNNDNSCTIMPGMAVRNAELRITGAGSFWDEVELISTSTSPTDS
jgi:hypothetical protein